MTTSLASPGVQDSRRSCAELHDAIRSAETVGDCLQLKDIAQTLSLEMQACVDLALARAEQLTGVEHVDGYK